jgi:hypothetical protein
MWKFYNASGEAMVTHAESEATQAEMEAETAVAHFVPPDLIVNNPYVAKHWGEFSMVGTHAIIHALNWTSVTDGTSAGDSDLLYATDFSGDDQILIGSGDTKQIIGFNAPVAGGCTVRCNTDAGTASDSGQCYVVGWGDRA